jgi:hypothetical protein
LAVIHIIAFVGLGNANPGMVVIHIMAVLGMALFHAWNKAAL